MPVISRSNARFFLWFIVLLPLTFGIGSFLLWLRRRFHVLRIDEAGVTLWCGRHEPWSRIRTYHFRKRLEDAGPRITRVDIQFTIGRGFIAPDWLQNGDAVVEAVRAGVRDRVTPGRRRTIYAERR